MNYWTQSPKNIWVAAHRGWSSKYPENTMEAYRAALDAGVDQLETDVRVSKDGELVLIHDATLDRTTNGTGKVCDYTLQELRQLDAGSWKDAEFAGCRIPTLREFFELVKDHPTMTLDVELKEYPYDGWDAVSYDVCDRTLAMVEEYGFRDRIVLNTWSRKLHGYIREKYGETYRRHVYYPLSYMKPGDNDPYAGAYCTCVCGLKDDKTPIAQAVAFGKETGVRLWAGAFVKDDETVDKAVKLGAELITCNNVDEVLAILRARGLHK